MDVLNNIVSETLCFVNHFAKSIESMVIMNRESEFIFSKLNVLSYKVKFENEKISIWQSREVEIARQQR